MRLQGKRRLRSPKLKITPRKPRGTKPEPEAKAETEAKADADSDELSWSPRMRKSEIRHVAERVGIEVQDDWSKEKIILALESVSE